MSKKKRAVQVLHKGRDVGDGGKGQLAVGKAFRFKSGTAYEVLPSGAVKNLNPKPYKNKKERRKMKVAIRAAKAEAAKGTVLANPKEMPDKPMNAADFKPEVPPVTSFHPDQELHPQ